MNNLTKADIIKAFALCDDSGSCPTDCPLAFLNNGGSLVCRTVLKKSMLDIYEGQKSEIERLGRLGASVTRKLVKARTESMTELAERLKE